MKTKILILFTSISLFLLACTKNPVTGKNEFQLVSEKIEISTGQEQYLYQQQAGGGTYVTDPDLVAYVNKVGQKLASVSDRPHLPYEFVILNNSIPNAWALPGGKIAIHRGLLVELHSEAELAAVLSHEIVHSAARHGAKAMERSLVLGAGLLGMGQVFNECKYEDLASAAALTGSQLIQFKYSREAELEADLYGIEYMFKAGYDLSASAELQKVFLNFSQDTNWLSGLFATHPPTKERLQRNLHTISKYPKLDGFIGKQEYEAAIAKLKEDQKSYDKLDKGYAFLKQGHFKQALQCAEEGLKDQPNEIHLYCLKAKAQSFLHKDREALDTLEKASKLHPSYFDFYLQKGSVNYRLGHLLDAKNDLKKSFSLLPTAEAAYLLGEIELDLGNETLANEYFQIASQSKDRYGQAARAKLTLRS